MTQPADTRSDLLEDELGIYGRDVRRLLLDSISCTLHNKGYYLKGNTEASDIDWVARHIWCAFAQPGHINRWEHLDEGSEEDARPKSIDPNTRVFWRKVARCATGALPGLMGRVADRMVHMSQVMRSMERACGVEDELALRKKYLGFMAEGRLRTERDEFEAMASEWHYAAGVAAVVLGISPALSPEEFMGAVQQLVESRQEAEE